MTVVVGLQLDSSHMLVEIGSGVDPGGRHVVVVLGVVECTRAPDHVQLHTHNRPVTSTIEQSLGRMNSHWNNRKVT